MEDERDLLRSEAESLRSRIRASLEEVDEFRTVTSDAEQVIAAARAAESRGPPSRRKLGTLAPALSEVRVKASDMGSEQVQLRDIDDQLLLRIVESTLRLAGAEPAGGEGEGQSPTSEGPSESSASDAKSEDDEASVLLKQKIQVQQGEIDRYLQIFHKQQEQVIKLQDQISGRGDTRNRELQQQVKDKLKDKEKEVE
ncbi:unnamed protein product, partial [Polarella glacialis]